MASVVFPQCHCLNLFRDVLFRALLHSIIKQSRECTAGASDDTRRISISGIGWNDVISVRVGIQHYFMFAIPLRTDCMFSHRLPYRTLRVLQAEVGYRE